MADNRTTWEYQGKDDLSAVLDRIGERMGALEGATGKGDSMFNKFFEGIGGKLFLFNQVAEGMERIGEGIKKVMEPFAAFEDKLTDFSVVSDLSKEKVDELGEYSRKLGEKFNMGAADVAQSLTAISRHVDDASALGVEGFEKLTHASVVMAKALKMNAGDAGGLMMQTMKQFGMGNENADEVVNIIAAGFKKGNYENFKSALDRGGMIAAEMGIGLKEYAAITSVMSEKVQMSKMSMLFPHLGDMFSDKHLADKGVTGIDIASDGLVKSLTKLEEKGVKFKDFFGNERLGGFASAILHSSDSIDKMEVSMGNLNTADEMGAKRMKILNEQWAHTKIKMEEVMITIGQKLAPAVSYLLEKFNGLVDIIVRNWDTISWPFKELWEVMKIVTDPFITVTKGAIDAFKSIGDLLGITKEYQGVVDKGKAKFDSVADKAFQDEEKGELSKLVERLKKTGLSEASAKSEALKEELNYWGGREQMASRMNDTSKQLKAGAILDFLRGEETKGKLSTDKVKAKTSNGLPDSSGVSAVVSGGSQVRNVIVNITKMVGVENMTPAGIVEGAKKAGDAFMEELVRAVRDAEIVLHND